MKVAKRKKVAFITSLNEGIPLFLLNEINYYLEHGIRGKVFFVMRRPGTYMPPEEWEQYYMSPLKTLLSQIPGFFKKPRLYLSLLAHALRNKTLFEFLIAWDFVRNMEDCQAIHAFFADHKLIIGYYCKKILGKNLSCSVYGYDVYLPKNMELIKAIFRETDFVVATNLLFSQLLHEKFSLPEEKILLARTVVRLDKYSNAQRYEAKQDWVKATIERCRGKFVILVVARLVFRKGIHVLLRALAKVKEKERVVLWVVGDGPERQKLEKLTRSLGLSSQVIFFGSLAVDDLLPLYQNCQIYCQPSITDPGGDKEGLPVAMTEAMAFEKPVIATKHADIPNVLPSILVPENDVEALAEAIETLMKMSEEELKRMGKRNREIVEREFSEQNYEKVIARFTSS